MLEPSFVRKFMTMLTSQVVSDAEASQLAGILGTREEFLAYLVVKSDFLTVHSDVRAVLMTAAHESGYEASTKRQVDGSLAASRSSSSELSNALRSVMEAEKTALASHLKLAEIEQQMIRFAVASGKGGASPECWIKKNSSQ